MVEGNVFKGHLFAECVNTPFLLLPNDAGMMLQLLVLIVGVVLLFCYRNAAAANMQTWGFFGERGVCFQFLGGYMKYNCGCGNSVFRF